MKRTIHSMLVLGSLSLFLLAGCYSSGVERNWGRSYRTNFKHMTANPEAVPVPDEPVGIDPQTAEIASQVHRKGEAGGTQQAEVADFVEIGTGSSN
jgi:hypothetical protein